jgi:hypothetical protein
MAQAIIGLVGVVIGGVLTGGVDSCSSDAAKSGVGEPLRD